MKLTNEKIAVLPIWPALVFAAIYTALTLLFGIDLVRHIFDGWTVADLFNRNVAGSGAGFDRTFFIDFWSGVPLLCLGMLFQRKHYLASSIVFAPFVLISYIPVLVYNNASVSFANSATSILSLIVYVYLLVNLILTLRR